MKEVPQSQHPKKFGYMTLSTQNLKIYKADLEILVYDWILICGYLKDMDIHYVPSLDICGSWHGGYVLITIPSTWDEWNCPIYLCIHVHTISWLLYLYTDVYIYTSSLRLSKIVGCVSFLRPSHVPSFSCLAVLHVFWIWNIKACFVKSLFLSCFFPPNIYA